MVSWDQGRASGRKQAFVWWHAVLWPLMLAGLATWLRQSGWDERLSALFFDASTQRFMAGSEGWVELIGHRVGKSAVLAVWLCLLAAALAASVMPAWAAHRAVLWTTVAAMGLGPALVTGLKDINTHACPWSLKQFGGAATYSAHWFVSRAEAGRCFPGGHAAGGFSLVALAFAGRVTGGRRLERGGFCLALVVGGLFSGVRLVQGAHFMSHNLWAAAIDWSVATLVFLPLLLARSAASSMPAAQRGSVVYEVVR